MNILLLASAFNGLTQRAWCALRAAGHNVTVELAPAHSTAEAMTSAVQAVSPDLIICPFLKHRVPAEVWRKWPTVIIHPGPIGDRGSSSLDYAIMDDEPQWGVTALSAVEELDAGPVWASRTFPMPQEPPAKAALYNGLVADAAMECVAEVAAKAADPSFRPAAQSELSRPVPHAAARPTLKRTERAFEWTQPAAEIVRRIRAADSSPGVRVDIEGQTVQVYDAAVDDGRPRRYKPGTIVGRADDAVAVATGDRAVWIGQAKRPVDCGGDGVKLPAGMVLSDETVPELPLPAALRETSYERRGDTGFLTVRCYNGAMSTRQCRRVLAVMEQALAEDTRVLVVRGTADFFSNGIHLGVIEAAEDPAAEAWNNINAINDLCTALATCTRQVTIAAFTAGAGAGGVMLGLAADVTVAREGVVLNPYYDIGLYGSELHTYTLPRRVGDATATRLLTAKLPMDAYDAREVGLVDAVGPREKESFDEWLETFAQFRAEPRRHAESAHAKLRLVSGSRPPAYFAAHELSEMAKDIFDDRSGFAFSRSAFVRKYTPTETPARLSSPRWSVTGRN